MKICNGCGKENSDLSQYCNECGAELQEISCEKNIVSDQNLTDEHSKLDEFYFRPVPDKEIQDIIHQKSSVLMKIISYFFILLIIVAIVIMIFQIRTGQRNNQIDLLYNSKTNDAIALMNGEKLDGKADGNIIDYNISINGDAAVVQTDKKLYSVTKDGIERICKESCSAIISMYGDYILYDEDDSAYLYNVKKRKTEKICDDIDINTAVFSPDGKTIAFNKTGSDELYIFENGKCEKVDENIMCVGVSDNARYLYALDYCAEPVMPKDIVKPNASDYDEYDEYKKVYDEYKKHLDTYSEQLAKYEETLGGDVKLYMYPSAKEKKRIEIDELSQSDRACGFTFNNSMSQIIYSSKGKTFFSEKGDECERICRDKITALYSDNNSFFRPALDSNICIEIDEELLNCSYISDDTIYFVNRKGECEEVADDINTKSCIVSDSDKKIYYLDNDGDLYFSDAKTGDDSERIAKDVISFVVGDDFKTVSYIDDNENLRYIDRKGDNSRIARDVIKVIKAPDGGIYYIDDDDTLYYAEKDEKEKISRDVEDVFAGAYTSLYTKKNSGSKNSSNLICDTYVSKNGNAKFDEKFKKYNVSIDVEYTDENIVDDYYDEYEEEDVYSYFKF